MLVTLVFLASMGGGMLYVWWLLVPLHWLATRDAGPYATAGFAFLAASSLSEVAWMGTYGVTGDGAAPTAAGLLTFVVTLGAFFAARLRRIPPTPAAP